MAAMTRIVLTGLKWPSRKRSPRGILRLTFFVLCAVLFLITVIQKVGEGNTLKFEHEKIDWHDYALIAKEALRKGPGEHGERIHLANLSPEEIAKKSEYYSANGFNAFASDRIALDRAVKDIRNEGCRKKRYRRNLPSVSIVVPFHNEHWSTLLRTVKSVLARSPEELLKEIILVDDFSDKGILKEKLDTYISEHLPKTRVVRAKKREGLIRARLLGAREATGDVIIFLDSHSEPNTNWLPPLLEPIAENHRTVVCPFIDIIDYETFEYRAQDEGARGGFDWELYYKRLPLLPGDVQKPTEPFRSPVMAGGLFAINREFFWELGGYDEGLDVWGGEQYELSFKIWQCGGQMLDAPCSRVGHIYRSFAPFSNPGAGDYLARNYRRVAEVWMDEYAEYVYKKRPYYRNIDPGDLTKQRALRQKLDCKPFKWFMTNIAFDIFKHYPPVEPPDYAHGEIRNVKTNHCLDSKFRTDNERVGVAPCIKDHPDSSGEQRFVLTWHKDLRPKDRAVPACFDVSWSQPRAPVVLYSCHKMEGNQLWNYRMSTKQLFHPVSGLCLDCDVATQEVFMDRCATDKASQQWIFENFNKTAIPW